MLDDKMDLIKWICYASFDCFPTRSMFEYRLGDIITSEYICVDASVARAHVIPNQDLMSIKFYANRRAALRSGRS